MGLRFETKVIFTKAAMTFVSLSRYFQSPFIEKKPRHHSQTEISVNLFYDVIPGTLGQEKYSPNLILDSIFPLPLLTGRQPTKGNLERFPPFRGRASGRMKRCPIV